MKLPVGYRGIEYVEQDLIKYGFLQLLLHTGDILGIGKVSVKGECLVFEAIFRFQGVLVAGFYANGQAGKGCRIGQLIIASGDWGDWSDGVFHNGTFYSELAIFLNHTEI